MDSFDVIVIGAGGSGLAAACSAAEAGGKVLVLERMPQPGGTTGIAIGAFTAARTTMQQAAGIEDSVDDHAEDAGLFAPPEIEQRNNEPLRHFFLSEAAKTWEWLTSLGLSFVGPSPEPPNRVPRMHNVVPGAKAYVATLQIALQHHGGRLICDATVERLNRQKGRVTGVTARVNGQLVSFAARKGVILAAGDYANNGEMLARFKGERFREIEGINPHASGHGHELASQAGAALVNMDVTYGPELRFIPNSSQPFRQWLPSSGWKARLFGRLAQWTPKWLMRRMIKQLLVTWQHPEDSLFEDGAILINEHGHRFVNERNWPEREIAVARQPDKIAYILLDGRLVNRYAKWPHFISTAPDIAYAYVADYLRLRADVARKAETLEAFAEALPLTELRQTIQNFNDYVEGQRKDEFGRTNDQTTLHSGPWVLLGPVKAYFTTTEGGAMIDHRMRVLNESGQTIPGLFAVGQNGLGGQILFGHGLHIAWAITSGRLAGSEVMQTESNCEFSDS